MADPAESAPFEPCRHVTRTPEQRDQNCLGLVRLLIQHGLARSPARLNEP